MGCSRSRPILPPSLPLPDEIWLEVAKHLEHRDLLNLSLSNRYLHYKLRIILLFKKQIEPYLLPFLNCIIVASSGPKRDGWRLWITSPNYMKVLLETELITYKEYGNLWIVDTTDKGTSLIGKQISDYLDRYFFYSRDGITRSRRT